MKKIIVVTLAALTLAVTVACAPTVEAKSEEMFCTVVYDQNSKIVYDKETKVMYVVSWSSYNRGTFTLLVNADGTPRLWED